MKIFFAIIISITTLSACTSNTTNTKAGDSTDTPTISEFKQDTASAKQSKKACYSYYKNKDTVLLTLVTFENKASGTLTYNLHEKDRNTGSIQGEMHGDTLFADYTFSSEGMESVRQVAFLKKDTTLVEGFGDVEEKGNTATFKNTAALKYDGSLVLTAIDCK